MKVKKYTGYFYEPEPKYYMWEIQGDFGPIFTEAKRKYKVGIPYILYIKKRKIVKTKRLKISKKKLNKEVKDFMEEFKQLIANGVFD
jgi:hypothetical protein